MSQKLVKYIYKYEPITAEANNLKLLKFLLYFKKSYKIKEFEQSISSWSFFNKLIINFSILNLFLKHDLNFVQKFLLKRLRKRKWKFRKRKINKIKFLRKLRKSLIHRKFLRKTINFFKFKNKEFFIQKNKKAFLPIINKIPLTERVLNNSYLEFFYKFKKEKNDIKEFLNTFFSLKSYDECDDNFRIYLRNYHQKPYWKFRLARIIHWKFFFKKKTLRKQRYKSFLPIFLKKHHKYSCVYIYFINIFILNQLSWTRTQKFITFLKQLLILKLSEFIYLLPVGFFKLLNWKKEKKKSFKARKKIGKWSYLNFRKFQRPWLQKKKNFPKVIKHLKPNITTLRKTIQYDPGTGSILILRKLENFSLSFSELLKANYMVKLHGYRYNV